MTPRRRSAQRSRRSGAPFLHRLESLPAEFDRSLFVGENGSGKSPRLEAVVECCGFNPEGGTRDHHRSFLIPTHSADSARLPGRADLSISTATRSSDPIRRKEARPHHARLFAIPEAVFKQLFAQADD
jgi:hypothetical protein